MQKSMSDERKKLILVPFVCLRILIGIEMAVLIFSNIIITTARYNIIVVIFQIFRI